MNSLKSFKIYQTLGRWLLVLICLTAIAYLSGQTFAEQDLRPKIRQQERIVEAIKSLPEVEFTYSRRSLNNLRNPVDFAHFWIRKGAHVFVYGIFGLALLAALGDLRVRFWKRWMLVLVLVFIVASVDEWHQSIVGDRTGMFRDAILDAAGFVVVSSLAFSTRIATRRFGRSRQDTPG
ncbi:MAG: VanZ family protein [Candidatus Aquicultor sp.]|nr:VanZ family protein [Candidatus Aquicultor sp.]